MNKKLLNLLLIIVALSSFLFGCGSTPSSISAPTSPSSMPIAIEGLDGTDGVPVDSPFSFKFQQPVQSSSVTGDTFFMSYGSTCDLSKKVPADITISDDRTSIYLTPLDPLEYSTTYTLCVTSGILYDDGTSVRGWSFTFTTVDRNGLASPQISSASPSNGDTDVSPSVSINVAFNIEMDSSTIDSDSFTLSSAGGAVSGSISYSADTDTATFTPSTPLASLTVYTATLTSAIKNSVGKNLAADFSVTFTTSYAGSEDNFFATPSVGVGDSHACALLSNGTVKCWGSNANGQLGQGTVNSPTQSASAVTVKNQNGSTLTGIVELAVANYTNFVRLVNGKVKAWGYNGPWASLGDGGPTDFRDTTHFAYPVNVIDANTNLPVSGVTSLKAHYTDACVIVNGGVKCWGPNSWGQVGKGSINYYPTRVTKATDVVDLEAGAGVRQLEVGGSAVCVLTSDNKVKCWGRDSYGSLGRGREYYCASGDETCMEKTPVYVLTNIDGTQLSDVTKLYFIYGSGCGVLSNGKFYCWGRPQLGSQTGVAAETPSLVGMTSLVAGDSSGCGISGSSVQCWGLNIANVGNVGVGNMSEIRYSAAQNVSTSTTAISVSSSISTTAPLNCAVLTDYTVECWGGNTYGQLGDGSATNRSTPVKVTDGETGGNLDLTP